jgi:hypothetical protein
MKVRCHDDSNCSNALVKDGIYDVISENGYRYILKGVEPAGWRKNRFTPLRQVKCVRADGTYPPLVKDTIYHILYTVDDGYALAEVGKLDSYKKNRFTDAYEGPPTLRSGQPIVKKDDDTVATQLAFFKKRADPNECPDGGTYGVCKYHPKKP